MTEQEESLYFKHILNSADRIETYLGGSAKADFLSSTLLQDAVVWQLEMIDEASNRISLETRALHPAVDWSKVIGL
jgi:uncharacterized protein with HEPN domain